MFVRLSGCSHMLAGQMYMLHVYIYAVDVFTNFTRLMLHLTNDTQINKCWYKTWMVWTVNMMISEIWVWQCELLISSRCEVRGKFVWLKSNKMLKWNGHQTSSRLLARRNKTTTSLERGNAHPVTVTLATPQHRQSEGEEQLRNLFPRQGSPLASAGKAAHSRWQWHGQKRVAMKGTQFIRTLYTARYFAGRVMNYTRTRPCQAKD